MSITSSINDTPVATIIVTYNGQETIANCMNSILPQVDRIIVVDNASQDNTLNIIEEIQSTHPAITLIKNRENVGLALALNQGITIALKHGYQWIMTLDDDSIAEPNMVKELLKGYYSLSESNQHNTAIIAPNYHTLKGLVYHSINPFFVTTAITSGQLIKAEAFKLAGEFKNDFFIECIDQEFCLRLKKFKLNILLVPRAILNQRLGNPTLRRFLWKKVAIANHSAHRYYYLYRNSLHVYANYFYIAPRWVIKNFIYIVYLFVKITLYEQFKLEKLKMMFLGCKDAMLGNYGKK